MLLAFIAAHCFSGTFSLWRWHACVTAAWLPLVRLCSQHRHVCLIHTAALQREG